MCEQIVGVPLEKSYRLLNLGATVLVSTRCEGDTDIMAAAWACALDFDKVSVVVDKSHYSRSLITNGEYFVVQIPTKQIVSAVMHAGSVSKHDDINKLDKIDTFELEGFAGIPLVTGCAGWLLCRRIPHPSFEAAHDLFVGEIVKAYADKRVFEDGHWKFETAPEEMRTLHYVAGGCFYTIGEALDA